MTTQAIQATSASGASVEALQNLQLNEFLTFTLGAEEYGVDILRVQEIRGWSPVTRIPQSPQHVLGVLNLRGSIVPIIDLRLRFGLERAAVTPLTVIVVLSVEHASGRREFGLVVDSVSDVLDLDASALREAPALGGHAGSEFIQGLATVAEKMLILLNVEDLLKRDLDAGADALAGAA